MKKNEMKRKMEQLVQRPYGPGPAKYRLPGTIGVCTRDPRLRCSPAFSFGKRSIIYDGDCSPGPKYLIQPNTTQYGIETAPKYSLYSRPAEIRPFTVPGPGQYLPEKYLPSYKKRAPSFSFGKRTEYCKREKRPAPNSYMLPVIIGPQSITMQSSPAYSLNGKPKRGGFSEDLKKTPGPGTYQIVCQDLYRKKQPKYSLMGRKFTCDDANVRPGPGIYSPEKVTLSKRCAPAFSFGIKHGAHVVLII